MSDAATIREAVERWNEVHQFGSADQARAVLDAAIAYADSLDDPIWWCFKHDEHAGYSTSYGRWCSTWELLASGDEENPEPIPCDIAKATRPRRIE